ncbi:MATE family efflux transporter [Sinisalibacter aestuarii]|uniref:MATE family efflux transporter n=1 Tax=Sinisalibacter aestuarii TaxID=2949426 RepID=A0ABQ5LTV5_9RHOB|nr:MATE family efflux transporter [Sinisalibacter aestuarii]GKY88409.1 MATE family efflux transporter [Sinisalibacter aestuarii]
MSDLAGRPGPAGITHSRVLHIAVPVVLSNVTVPVLGAVDTGVVGQLGEAAPIGAVGIGAIILTSIYWIFGFLRMGTAGLTAQARGAGDTGEVAALLTRSLLIGLAAGVAFILLQAPLFWAAFRISPATDEVESLARSYMAIRIWSAPAMIALYGVMGWLIAQERTRALFGVQFVMNAANIVLDLIFVLGFGWGVEGVAIATFIAEWSGFALGLWFCRAAFRSPAWKDWARVFHRITLVRMMKVNSDILIRSLLLEAIFVSFMFFGADFGDVTLAANQVLLQFLFITAYGMDGFAFGAESLVGQALGARDRATLRRAAYVTSLWGLYTAMAFSVAFWLLGGWIIDVMAKAPEVQAEARIYLPWMAAAPVMGWAAWMLDGIFIGATATRDMRNMMVLSALIYLVALLVLVPLIGNHGLWAALIVSFVARGISLGTRYPALERSVGP